MAVESRQAPFAVPILPVLAGVVAGAAVALSLSGKTKAQAALVVPKEFHTTGLQYANWNQAGSIVNSWLVAIRDWYNSQVGGFPDTELQVLLSQHTWAEFKGSHPGDACGDDFDEVNIFLPEGFLLQELGWSFSPPFKHWLVVVGAGGWAGGNTSFIEPLGKCSGTAAVGDWELKNALGVAAPCNPGFTASNCHSFGHEISHTMAMAHAHDPVIYCGDPMTDVQKQEVIVNNHLWWGA